MGEIRMKTLAYLHISQHTDANNRTVTHGEERIQQYLDGFSKFFEYPGLQKFDILVTDNTITEDCPLDKRLQDLISSYKCRTVLCDNNHGKQNKGAGVLEQWRYCRDIILEYDWIIPFEPRQLLLNFDFFDSFFEAPRNLFHQDTGHAGAPCFWTGLFAASSGVLIDFVDNSSLGATQSIEYVVYDYIKDRCEFDTIEKLNLAWNDAAQNKWEEM